MVYDNKPFLKISRAFSYFIRMQNLELSVLCHINGGFNLYAQYFLEKNTVIMIFTNPSGQNCKINFLDFVLHKIRIIDIFKSSWKGPISQIIYDFKKMLLSFYNPELQNVNIDLWCLNCVHGVHIV